MDSIPTGGGLIPGSILMTLFLYGDPVQEVTVTYAIWVRYLGAELRRTLEEGAWEPSLTEKPRKECETVAHIALPQDLLGC